MSEQTSPFKFNDYKILRTLIEVPKNKTEEDKFLSINISPSGFKEGHLFYLTLDITVKNKSGSLNIEVSVVGEFEFIDTPEDKLNSAFTINAPAILFPYIRAYISTLTNLSGVEVVNLPTLNLTKLGETLKNNITTKP